MMNKSVHALLIKQTFYCPMLYTFICFGFSKTRLTTVLPKVSVSLQDVTNISFLSCQFCYVPLLLTLVNYRIPFPDVCVHSPQKITLITNSERTKTLETPVKNDINPLPYVKLIWSE